MSHHVCVAMPIEISNNYECLKKVDELIDSVIYKTKDPGSWIKKVDEIKKGFCEAASSISDELIILYQEMKKEVGS